MSTAVQDPPAQTAPVVPVAAVPAVVATPAATPPATAAAGDPTTPAATSAPVVADPAERTSILGQADAAPAPVAVAPVVPAASVPDVVYALRVPTGVDKTLADQMVLQATEFAKAHKVAPEIAQKLLERDVAQRKAIHDNAKAIVTKQWNDFEAAAKADPQIGGHKYDETIRLASRAMAEVPDGLRELLRKSAMGSHPEVLRYLAQRGKALSEGAAINAGGPPPAEIKGKNLWYPPKSTFT